MKIIFIVFILIYCNIYSFGQSDTCCYAIKVLKNGKKFKEKTHMDIFSKSGFYIYQNYCYKIEFKDKKILLGRIEKISNDSIRITSAFNSNVAKNQNIKYDTIQYSIKDINKIILISGHIDGNECKIVDLKNFSLELVKSKCCDGISKIISNKDSNVYLDGYRFLTNNSIAIIYEEDNILRIYGARY